MNVFVQFENITMVVIKKTSADENNIGDGSNKSKRSATAYVAKNDVFVVM